MDPTQKPTIEEEIRQQLVINDQDLPAELIDHPTKQFYWGSMWARAAKQERTQKLLVEQLEADLSKEFRERQLATAPEIRVTEKMVKEYITSHPSYIEAAKRQIQAGYMADLFNVCKNAFESRGRMLLELSRQANEGKFYENEFRNMQNEFERREEEKVAKSRKRRPAGSDSE